jgi:diaminohydroxyphosphoribosylaminopyrimidine deaminase/5-amino-6-(5-phosphoribosylamino)uracil reductase
MDKHNERFMCHALQLAARGEGRVEPNPMVGCVFVQGDRVIGEGWHDRFGGPHAEVEALSRAGNAARGATMYVTLEPCCHHGKTPPCTDAIISAGIKRVVVASRDPFPRVDGGGIRQLEAAGIRVESGVLQVEAQQLNAPYFKRLKTGRPWVIAKWAMTLDGKLATSTGDSQWISNEKSREVVHALRGRVDAIIVGRKTVEHDDPLLTARPPGPRTATRVVFDSHAELAIDSQLVRSAATAPVLVVARPEAAPANVERLAGAGCEVLSLNAIDRAQQAALLLDVLGRREMTNVLIEGGATLLGTFLDGDLIDEVHVFVAPKLAGGKGAVTPIAGVGAEWMRDAIQLQQCEVQQIEQDGYIHGRVAR